MDIESTHIIANFSDATDELLPLFRELIHECYEVTPLGGYRIKFLYSHKERKSQKCRILGTCKPFPAKDKLFHDWDAVITFDLTFWEANPDKRKVLMFHELCHLEVNELTGQLQLVGHDTSEFFAVWKRFGDWQGELKMAKIGTIET